MFFCSVLFLALVVLVGYVYYKLTRIPKTPTLDLMKWWGPGEPKQVDTTIRPFKIEFKQEMIQDLKERLKRTTFTQPLDGVGFNYGFNNDYLKEVVEFWHQQYNFTERESYLNKYPHFKTNIQGLDIHFIHIKPTVSTDKTTLPLLMMHGWPGSIREFYEVIPLLTAPRDGHDFVFELIVPSLPGYGYSQATSKPGLGLDQVAIIYRNLMHRLGHERFYIQGGDMGSVTGSNMATFFQKEVLLYHTNMPVLETALSILMGLIGNIFPSLIIGDEYRHWLRSPLKELEFVMEQSGYLHIQATKPDTIGVSLRDSPAGLAAYILEKFSGGANQKLTDGGITQKFTLTDLLDNVMIYWTNSAMPTAMRMYAETFNKRFQALEISKIPVHVPTAIAYFKHEISYIPESIMRLKYKNIVHVSHFEVGGHFAAFERPDAFANDIWSAVSTVRNSVRV